MRKIFTQFFGFLLLSIMTIFSLGPQAQETQSAVKLYASSVDACYDVTNSYASTISAKDFIQMKSFRLTLNFDKSEFAFDAVSDVNPLLGGVVNAIVDNSDPINGIVQFEWTSDTEVTIADAILFNANFKVLSTPNSAEGNNLFDSPLAADDRRGRSHRACRHAGRIHGSRYAGRFRVGAKTLEQAGQLSQCTKTLNCFQPRSSARFRDQHLFWI